MKAVVFDTETTGLISNGSIKLDKQPRVVDLYAAVVDLKSGRIEDELDTLINPGIPIPDESVAITGITDEMVSKAPPFIAIAPHFRAILEKGKIAVAHNARYDYDILNFEFKRINESIKWPRLVCTVEQTVHMKGYRLSLEDLHTHLFNERFLDAHRAKPDTQATIRCAVELYRRNLI